MLNNAIEKNKRLLGFCSHVAQISGLLLLLLGFIFLLAVPWGFYMTGGGLGIVTVISRYVFRLIFPGLFLLGINQFIKSLLDINFRANWILKFSDKIIYLYVFLLIVNSIRLSMSNETIRVVIVVNMHHFWTWIAWVPFAISIFVKALLWIGMAQVLQRIVPMIEESRTLV
jgi:hypothetical protein